MQKYEWFKCFKNGRMSVDDDECSGHPLTAAMIGNVQKCERLSWRPKINDSWHLQHCRIVIWNVPANFVPRLTSSDQKWNTTLLSALTSRNTFISIITGDKSWVFGHDPEMKRQSSHRKTPTSPQPKKAWQGWSNVQLMLICFFDSEDDVHNEFVRPGQAVNGIFYCDVLRQMRETIWQIVQISGATSSGPCIMTMMWLMHHMLCGSYWLLQTRPSSPTLPTHTTSPLWFFSWSRRLNLSSRGDIMAAMKIPRTNHGMWWRHCREITFRSASDHGNPAGIAVSKQKGITLKGMEVNRNLISS
jgi:hypothetical protein